MAPSKEALTRTRLEMRAGRAAIRKYRRERKATAAARASDVIVSDAPIQETRQVPPVGYSARDPQEHNQSMSAVDPSVPLPDAIAICIERADRAYQLAYHPGIVIRFRRWLCRKLWA